MAQEKINIAGIVLCGGASRRMGTSKAWLEFDGETLLQRIVRVLSTMVRPLVVAAAVNQELPRLPADVLIVNGARTVLDFLISPITDSMRYAMKEE